MPDNPSEDDTVQDQRIRERAYHLWQADGEPHGRDQEYWERARDLVAAEHSRPAAEIAANSPGPRRARSQPAGQPAAKKEFSQAPGPAADKSEPKQAPRRKVARRPSAPSP